MTFAKFSSSLDRLWVNSNHDFSSGRFEEHQACRNGCDNILRYVANWPSHSYVKLEFKCNYFQGNCDTITCVKLQNEIGGDTNSRNNQLQFLYLALTYKLILLEIIKLVLKIERARMSFTFFFH